MRNDIVHIGAGELTYEIRAIVEIAEKMQALGLTTRMENIGDPVAKGETIPAWMKEIVADLVREDATWGYCPTKGLLSTREFIADRVNARGGAHLDAENILFFNGLGDAIQKVYGFLRREARVIGPSPTYSTHSSGEAAHAGHHPVSYRLDPMNGWYPDIEDLRLSVKYNPAVSGLLIINPDNPTGAVFPERILEDMIAVAREFDLFVIADEIYTNLVYNGQTTRPISDLVGDVPALVMRGISKDLPWPGARCGWVEVYNQDKDPVFHRYVQSIVDAKRVEVCSTTLPQAAIPRILSHPEFESWLDERRARYERRSRTAYRILKDVPGIRVNRTNGAFYMSVVFEKGALAGERRLPIGNEAVLELVEGLVAEPGLSPDKRFVYWLLGATGICVVPLSSFCSDLQGFRTTLLEIDDDVFTDTLETLARSIREYLA